LARVLPESESLPISVKSGFHICPRFDVLPVALVFVPTEKEKAKIQWFIDNFSGEEDDPWLRDMVKLAKAVLEEVH